MIVVLADGCFDLFHIGHLIHLEQARALGDKLIVAVTKDAYVNKGPGRPMFKLEDRIAMLKALRIVSEVCAVQSGADAVKLIQPDIYVKGEEYAGRLPEQALVESYGGRVIFTRGRTFSSTAFISGGYLKAASASDR